ncbi:MAG: Putative carbohydrate kinase-like protein [Clostridiales bacterium 38_11]|nr:MAG: Putative carbohydrate kinase-like protein [Clostridiales bacterium 38_11]HBH12740.1 carbohydrate kinase-like protein [Clostridiales bacterium]
MINSGIDIVEVKRIERLIKNKSFVRKIFSDNEIAYLEERKYKATTAAGIFCAKEAVSKCIGTGIAGFSWHDIEIHRNELGRPYVVLGGRALNLSKENGIVSIDISITHIEDYALSIAIAKLNESIIPSGIGLFLLPAREADTHKGDYGKLGVVGGKEGMSGSVYLAGLAALKSGTGLVYLIPPISIYEILSIKLNEVIIEKLSESQEYLVYDDLDKIMKYSEKYDVMCLGTGIGTSLQTKKMVISILSLFDKPIVLDADGLNCINGSVEILKNRQAVTIITPHTIEMARLMNLSPEAVERDRINIAMDFSKQYGVITVLKGHKTIVSNGEELYVNTTGNPGMATAGSGDVLTGIIGALVSQGYDPYLAAKLGVFIHGLAGDLAKAEYGEYGMIASNLIEYLPYAIKTCTKKE